MRKLGTQASVVVGLFLSAHLALADTVVHLKNGDVASGTPVEITRGEHVILKLATGDVRTYAWADIESVTDDGAKPPAAPAPVVVTPAPAAGVLVHLDANDDHAMLATSSGFGEGGNGQISVQIEEYKSFCMVPCDKSVPPGVYRIVGRNLTSTDDFTIPEGARAVQLDATMHSRARLGWGKMMTMAGIAFAISGGFLLAVPALVTSGSLADSRTMFYAAGGAMVVAGVGLLVGGIYLLATSGSSVEVKTTQSGVGRFLTHGMQLAF